MSKHPSDIHSDLTDDRLSFLANKIIEQVYLTYETNVTSFDDTWTQGAVIFGRVKNALKELALSSEISWVGLAKDGMGLTPTIGEVPFRFASDDPNNPQKKHILEQSIEEIRQLGFAFDEPSEQSSNRDSIKWRWYIEKCYREEDDPSVSFVGLDQEDQPVCTWSYNSHIPIIHEVGGLTPSIVLNTEAPVIVPAAAINIKKPS